MAMQTGWKALCLATTLAASGCTTFLEPRSRISESDRLAAERANLTARVARLENRIEAMELLQQKQAEDALAGRFEAEQRNERITERVAALEKNVAQNERAQAADRQAVLDLIRKASAPRTVVQQGREHTVAQGETLSEIAKAYATTVPAIVQANKLRDAHTIRVGQKLFIPE